MNIYELMAPCFYDLYDDIKAGAHNEYWLKGGRGSCKSSFAALALIRTLLSDPEANCIVYRRVAATLRDSVYAKLTWAVEALGLQAYFRLRRAPLEIEYLPTGQRILFRGADDPLKSKSISLRSGYFACLWFEELAEFDGEEGIRTIVQSVMRGSARGFVIATYNPPVSASCWVNAAALKPRDGRLIHHSTYLDVPASWLGERFLAEARALEKGNERAYRNEYLGEVTGTGGQVFDNLILRPITDAELKRLERQYCGLDFGFAQDPDAFVRCAYEKSSGLVYILDEYTGLRDSALRLSQQVISRAKDMYVYCDSAEPRMISELKRMGVKALAVKKGPGSREHGFKWLQTLPGIVIDPARTPFAAAEFSALEYPRAKDGTILNACPDGNDHTVDALRYALEREMTRKTAYTMKGG